MKNGQILVENSPNNLLKQYGHDSLEDVFLQICRDIQRKKKDKKAQFSVVVAQDEAPPTPQVHLKPARKSNQKKKATEAQNEIEDTAINNADAQKPKQVRFSESASVVILPGQSDIEPSLVDTDNSEDEDFEDGAKRPLVPKNLVSQKKKSFCATKPRQVLGVMRRKVTQIVRNPVILAWEVLVPTLQIVMFMIAIGQQPHNLSVVVRQNLI